MINLKKELWNNEAYDKKLQWLKTRKDLYTTKGDIFGMADVYARTKYHLLQGNVQKEIENSWI